MLLRCRIRVVPNAAPNADGEEHEVLISNMVRWHEKVRDWDMIRKWMGFSDQYHIVKVEVAR